MLLGKTVPVVHKRELSCVFVLMLYRWWYFISASLIIMMIASNWLVSTLYKVLSKHRAGGFSSTTGQQADDTEMSILIFLDCSMLLLLMAILLKRDNKASEKCTNCFWVLSSGMHSKPAAVGKYTSTSEQFSCQVQKGAGLSHYLCAFTCSHQRDVVREQKPDAITQRWPTALPIPPSLHIVLFSQLR